MKEHTSQPLSQRLHDAGFRGEHTQVWFKGKVRWYIGSKLAWENSRNHTIYPTYTFTELWEPLDVPSRYELIKHIQTCFERDDLAEIAGEWLIDNNHMEVSK